MRSVAVFVFSALVAVGTSADALAEPVPGPASVSHSAHSLDALLAAFRGSVGVEALFVEKRVMALLAAPLQSEGTIYFAPPGLLARYVTHPTPSFQIIEPHRVRFGDASKIEAIDLASRPQVRSFVESFVALLAGDRPRLERDYLVEFIASASNPAGNWRLVLKPRSAPMNKVIASISLEGSGLIVKEMRLLELEGDETITTFSKVDHQRHFSEGERDRIFKRREP